MSEVVVCALYKFVRLNNYQDLRAPLWCRLDELGIRGTLLLASEAINGIVAGGRDAINGLLKWLEKQPGLDGIETKESFTDMMPFKRTKVKLKKEIVTMGVEGVDPRDVVGTYVDASEWNALIEDPEVLLVDTRNEYEIEVGTFENAVNPHTETFREFPEFVDKHLDATKHKKVAMFCTGGIRCEKSTAYLKQQGFESVYHLKGGILKYLETVPGAKSKWQGECFVFDDRVTVDHNLDRGSYDQCHACRLPITEEDKTHAHYTRGVSCPRCHDKTSAWDRARFAERERQIELARERGEVHIGPEGGQIRDAKTGSTLKKKEQAA